MKKKAKLFAGKWIELEVVVLREEVSQMQKDTGDMLPFTYGSVSDNYNKIVNMYDVSKKTKI